MWVEKVSEVYGVIQNPAGQVHHDPDIALFRQETRLSIGDLFQVAAFSYVLILIPFVFAFLTSYNTPMVGISCRSLTFLVYAMSQFLLILLWAWPFASGAASGSTWNRTARCVLALLGGLGATFAAIGGTMMQIMGVYRACLCQLPIRYWHNPSSGPSFPMGSNSAHSIANAATYWKGLGAGATGFLILVCYSGWWYQRRLRKRFSKLVRNLDDTARRQ